MNCPNAFVRLLHTLRVVRQAPHAFEKSDVSIKHQVSSPHINKPRHLNPDEALVALVAFEVPNRNLSPMHKDKNQSADWRRGWIQGYITESKDMEQILSV